MKKWRNLLLILTLFVFAGCASKGEPKQDKLMTSARTPPPIFRPMPTVPNLGNGEIRGISITGTGLKSPGEETGEETSEPLFGDNDDNAIPTKRIIYFDYDLSKIKPEYQKVLKNHAAYMNEHPETAVRLEGHADERGSREYNLALAEQRAESAKEALTNIGVFNSQLSTLSYGEERPAALGHNQKSWWKNRRVEFIYP
jgi:peptidoglycan-associated lipoprotein